MNLNLFRKVPVWSVAVPVAACGILAVSGGNSPGWVLLLFAAAALIALLRNASRQRNLLDFRRHLGILPPWESSS